MNKEEEFKETLQDSEDKLQALVNFLNDSDLHIRKEAVRNLSEMKSPEASDILISALGKIGVSFEKSVKNPGKSKRTSYMSVNTFKKLNN